MYRRNCFIQAKHDIIIFVQFYIGSSEAQEIQPWLIDQEVAIILDSLEDVIQNHFQEVQEKVKQKSLKFQAGIVKRHGLCVSYEFRANSSKDTLLIEDYSTDVIPSSCLTPHSLRVHAVFRERLIVTAIQMDKDSSPTQARISQPAKSDASKYFLDCPSGATMSAKRRKAALSKMKKKVAINGDKRIEEIRNDENIVTERNSRSNNLSEVCQQFAFNKNILNREMKLDTTKSTLFKHTKLIPHKNNGGNMRRLADDPEDRIARQSKRRKLNTNCGNEQTSNNHDTSSDDSIVELDSDRLFVKGTESASQSLDGDRLLVKGTESASQSLDGDRLFLKGTESTSQSHPDKPKTKPRTLLCVDDYDEVSLEQISCIANITVIQIRALVRSLERKVRDIFEGKTFSERHQEYKKGGANRANLAFDFHYGDFSEEQQECVTDTLRKMFCYKHIKYFDYVLRVLVPETMMMIAKMIENKKK